MTPSTEEITGFNVEIGELKVGSVLPNSCVLTSDIAKETIIIPTKDHADILDTCLSSLYKNTNYENYEIIVVNNNSEEKATFDLLDKYSKKDNFQYLTINEEFNYSHLNNEAAKKAKGDYIKDNNLGGMMIWEVGEYQTNLLIKSIYTNFKKTAN